MGALFSNLRRLFSKTQYSSDIKSKVITIILNRHLLFSETQLYFGYNVKNSDKTCWATATAGVRRSKIVNQCEIDEKTFHCHSRTHFLLKCVD